MTDLEAAVAEAATILDELAVPHMLIGGLAVSAWGEARATLDVDLSLWVEPERLASTVAMLCSRLEALPGEPLQFARETRVLPMRSSHGIRLDLVFAALPAEQALIARAHTMQIGGRSVKVAAVEDLIWMKLISERPQDIDDARRLVRRFRRTLDREYLEPRLRELSEAFARPDILELFRGEMNAPERHC
jgi:Nucleotidyl transferase AbiEii toxin, Type IV TA system